MRIHPGMTRRALIAGGVCGLGFPGAALAQLPRPTREKLERMIGRAFADEDTVTFARPQILGFQGELRTRQFGVRQGAMEYHFAVADPRRDDDLILFTNVPDARLFKMHRTGFHLRRVASALNDASQTSGLAVWAGPDCDADFAAQLAYWARANV